VRKMFSTSFVSQPAENHTYFEASRDLGSKSICVCGLSSGELQF